MKVILHLNSLQLGRVGTEWIQHVDVLETKLKEKRGQNSILHFLLYLLDLNPC